MGKLFKIREVIKETSMKWEQFKMKEDITIRETSLKWENSLGSKVIRETLLKWEMV